MKHSKWKTYAAWILFTEAVGALSGWLTRDGVALYKAAVEKPPLSPPSGVFPIVWGLLYALLGIGAARIYMTPAGQKRSRCMGLYFTQLAFNFLWSIVFFNRQAFGFAFVWLLVLWGLILAMTVCFSGIDRRAAVLQIPYLLWVAFAGYLNLGVTLLN